MTRFKTPGSYVCISTAFWDDEAVESAGIPAAALFLAMICKIGHLRSDGWITQRQVERLCHPKWRQALDALISNTLVIPEKDRNGTAAYYLPGYLKWNKSDEQIKETTIRASMVGKSRACHRHHDQPCDRNDCAEAHEWLKQHAHKHA